MMMNSVFAITILLFRGIAECQDNYSSLATIHTTPPSKPAPTRLSSPAQPNPPPARSAHVANRNVFDEGHDITRRAEVEEFGLLEILEGHTRSLLSVAYSNDGTRIVSGSQDDTIKIWDAVNGGQELKTLTGHTRDVRSVAFNHDGSRIVSGSSDNTIKVWDAIDGGRLLQTLEGHTQTVFSVSFNHDGSRIASGSGDGTIKIWDAVNGGAALQTLPGDTDRVWSVAFNNDGSRIASGNADFSVKIWDAVNGGQLLQTLTGHTRRVDSVAFNHDGTKIASGSDDTTVRIWDAVDGGPALQTLNHGNAVSSISYNNNGTRIASGSLRNNIKLWDAVDGGPALQTLNGHTDWVRSVSFNHDGSRLASGSRDTTIRIWEDLTSKPPSSPSLKPSSPPPFSPELSSPSSPKPSSPPPSSPEPSSPPPSLPEPSSSSSPKLSSPPPSLPEPSSSSSPKLSSPPSLNQSSLPEPSSAPSPKSSLRPSLNSFSSPKPSSVSASSSQNISITNIVIIGVSLATGLSLLGVFFFFRRDCVIRFIKSLLRNSDPPDNFPDITEQTSSKRTLRTLQPQPQQVDVFLTHNWGNDEMGRNNHKRVSAINNALKGEGITTWFDDEKLNGDIVRQMTSGIDNAKIVIVFLTQTYIDKVRGESRKGINDNCKIEFEYAVRKKTGDNMISVVMEHCCKDQSKWDGAVGAFLGGRLYTDFRDDSKLDSCIECLMEDIERIKNREEEFDDHAEI